MNYFTEAKKLFSQHRPLVFINHPNHCEECQDVDAIAQRNAPETLTQEEAASGWADLHCFLNGEGFLYFMPSFINFCLDIESQDNFIASFLFAITYDGSDNKVLINCNHDQKKFIVQFLEFYKIEHQNIVTNCFCEQDLENAISLWAV